MPSVINRQFESSAHRQRTPDGLRRVPLSLTIAQSHRDRQPAVLRPGPPGQVPAGHANGRTPQAGPLRTASVSGSVFAAHQPFALPTRERAGCRPLVATMEIPECTDMSGGRNDGQQRGNSRRRQRIGDNRSNLLDGRRCAQLHQSALPLRRGRVRLRKYRCCSAVGKLSSATSSNARNGGTSGLRGFH